MASIVDSFEEKSNFWEVNPQLKAAGPFKDLYNSDKSTNKVHSSKKMWSVALICDMRSKFYNLPLAEKEELIFDDYFGDSKWPEKNRELLDSLYAFYIKLSDTSAMRTLREIESKLEERSKFLKETEYTMGEKSDKGWIWGTAKELDTMISNTKKIYDMYEEARKVVEQEQQAGTAVGGAEQSLSDKGDL